MLSVSAYRKQRDAGSAYNTPTPLPPSTNEESMMGKSNLSQHELHLKYLEKSIREICQMQNEVCDTFYQTLNTFNTARDMTMRLFVVADDLRATRLDFEKAEGH
jgi:hypothetical protein